MITTQQLTDAAFWEETICVNCGATGGEPLYACFECDKQIVLAASLIKELVESVEVPEDE